MNTKINYMYRDAANYKIHCEEVVKGEIDEKVCEEILEDMDCEPFYPTNIGFRAPTFVSQGYKPYDDDPDCHELYDLELTDEEPTVGMTAEEFVEAFRSGKISERSYNPEMPYTPGKPYTEDELFLLVNEVMKKQNGGESK